MDSKYIDKYKKRKSYLMQIKSAQELPSTKSPNLVEHHMEQYLDA